MAMSSVLYDLRPAALVMPVKAKATATNATAPAGFQMSANPTPNISGKIHWELKAHRWKVKIQKAKYVITETFQVDTSLKGEAYEIDKVKQYRSAADAWNCCDGSKRHRIKLAPSPAATPAATKLAPLAASPLATLHAVLSTDTTET